jgi:tripartite ATP-independent transporter DctM subunit
MAIAMFVALFLLLLLGFPVAFTLAGVAVFFATISGKLSVLMLMPSAIYGIMNNYVLIAVPLFVFMGVMLEKSGIAEELLDTMALLFGRLRGGLAISVVVVGALLAASTGIVGATVVTMGLLSLPTMLRRGYSTEMSTGVICASGTLGQIIPPSIVLVLLGDVLQVQIGDMFVAAVIPGAVLVSLYVAWIIIIAICKPEAAPAMPADELAAFQGAAMLKRLLKAFLPPVVLVLGSIFMGIATPTEAAAVGALGAMVLTLIRRRFSLKTLRSVMKQTMTLTCMVFMILVGARAFSQVFRSLGGDHMLRSAIESTSLGPMGFLILVMIVIFIAGFFIDFIEITFIIVPVIVPIFVHLGIDPLWAGILIAINLQTSFLTPPFGFSLFYLKGVAPPSVTTGAIYRGIIPFIIIQALALALVFAKPGTATWLVEKLQAQREKARAEQVDKPPADSLPRRE